MKLGSVIIFNSTKGGRFSAAQRFFTRMPYTHVAGSIGTVSGEESILEAKMSVSVTPWKHVLDNKTEEYFIFEPTSALKQKDIEDALYYVYDRFAGETYGFLQLLWFVYRWIAESWPFKADVRKKGNWFPDNQICSEVWWWYLHELATKYPDISNVIEEWNSNSVNAGDMFMILRRLPKYFTLTQTRLV